MKIQLASDEHVITALNTSILSTIVYALGMAIEHEDDVQVKKDLEATEEAVTNTEDLILIYKD